MWSHRSITYVLLLGSICAYVRSMPAESAVKARVSIEYAKQSKRHAYHKGPNAVVWLTAVSSAARRAHMVHPGVFRLEQKDKEFIPHLLVVPVDSTITFPNLDPFYHNVFSMFNGRRFDLGLYETGQSRGVAFDHVGVSYIFCNIHPEMSAVVIALDTPYYAVVPASGNLLISNVPPGAYYLNVWAEGASEAQLASLARRVQIASSVEDLGTISIAENPAVPHKNKFGEDYLKPEAPIY